MSNTTPEFQPGNGASQDLQDFTAAFMPYFPKTDDGNKLRRVGFRSADMNGNGMVSLAEMENFIIFALQEVHSKERSDDLFDTFRPTYLYSFNNAKGLQDSNGDVLKGATSATEDDYVGFSEFRMFNIFLCIYATMFDAFISVDGGSEGRTEDDDSRIDLTEFLNSYESIQTHGFTALKNVTSNNEATELFHKIDLDNGGLILFSEWSKFLSKAEIESNTSMGKLLACTMKPKESKRSAKGSISSTTTNRSAEKKSATPIKSASPNKAKLIMPVKVCGAYQPGKNASDDLKLFIAAIQPYSEKTPVSGRLRQQAFRACDGNGSGQCSLAEVDNHVQVTLKKEHGPEKGMDLFKRYRASYIRAFNASKAIADANDDNDDDYITFPEFRVLNAYLCVYAGMLDVFSLVDGGGEGIDENDDRRVELSEWLEGYEQLSESGFIAMRKVHNEEAALKAFEKMDRDNGGKVLFAEFCEYIKQGEIAHNTALGKLLNSENMKPRQLGGDKKPSLPKENPTPVKARSQDKSAKTTKTAKTAKTKLIMPVKVCGAYQPGKNASDDLKLFISSIQPFAEKTPVSQKLRQQAFRSCDGNGSGKCSLAEVDSHVQAALKKEHGPGKGSDLFKRYRASYIRAFNASKSVAVDDDYITYPEFRILNAYLCVYAGMLDVFSLVDGGGEGIDENDDRRVELSEWLEGYEQLSESGFIGLRKVRNEKNAVAAFEKMDSDGRGMVLFAEFAEYIRQAEIEHNTPLGKLLDSVNLKPYAIGGKKPTDTSSKKSNESKNLDSIKTVEAVEVLGAYRTGKNASDDLKLFITAIKPLSEKTPEAGKLRQQAFRACDGNGSGRCSLAEVDSHVQAIMKKEYGPEKGPELFDLYRASYIRAFNASKAIAPSKGKDDDDYITFPEFRVLNAYLCVYAGMLDVFSLIDGGGAGFDKNDDRRVDLSEWLEGYAQLSESGFIALRKVNSEEAAAAAFGEMDGDNGGKVLFAEFCEYIKQGEMENNTALGKLLDTDSMKPKQIEGQNTRRSPLKENTGGNKVKPAETSKKSNTIKFVKICDAYQPGKNASNDLNLFLTVLQPLTEKTSKAGELRKDAFRSCDGNGSGQCSLAEVDSHVQTVMKKEHGPEKGMDLFKRYRASYIRAFNAAKAIAAAKDDNDDDYVTFPEFRLLNAYLCVYAGMLDVFSLVDGGGEGIDENDDRRVELTEWLEGYEQLSESGFVGVRQIDSEEAAVNAFKEMDEDGRGMVLFAEFCEYIKKAEIAENTALGELLNK